MRIAGAGHHAERTRKKGRIVAFFRCCLQIGRDVFLSFEIIGGLISTEGFVVYE
jgi:hypothetical protein